MLPSHTRARHIACIAAIALVAVAPSARADLNVTPGSLVISTTTYADVGQVAGITVGSTLPYGGKAVSNGNLNTVWNNETPDPSFGVTSEISLETVNGFDGAVTSSENVTAASGGNVVTSFSSKSELSLNITSTSKSASGYVTTLMGYYGAALGSLDVSNSNTVNVVDPTNPVTSSYNRAVVAVSNTGAVSATQTNAYSGNNGRAAVLAPNGLYYTVGNSNNGTGTPKNVTTSTGLEVVTPGSTTNSTMIDPGYTSVSGDKAGKDTNFRGLTYYNGNLYFTKGSGSNGIDTVYTVSDPGGALPTAATASQAVISVLPGFSTSKAKSAADFTPFGLFFANNTTLYVADEGTGDSTDASAHAGLEKWSLVGGTWKLDYTLQTNLIGQTYSVNGWNYSETTTGLRDLAGKVNADGTVTLWADTATTSASGDNGADPNEVVTITDTLASTTGAGEKFSVLEGPQAGLRYGGVAFAGAVPELSTWAMMLIGFGGVTLTLRRRAGFSV